MKKIIKLILTVSIITLLAACGAEEPAAAADPGPEQLPVPNPIMITQPTDPNEPVRLTEPPDEPIEDLFPPSGYTFTLTEKEEAVLGQLITELNTDVFERLSPISVMKIFVEAGIRGEWEAEFSAFSQEDLETTKAEWEELNGVDLEWFVIESRRSLANWVFPRIDDALVLERGNRAVVVFFSIPNPEDLEEDPDFPGELHVMSLLQNNRGIWEVRFRPHAMDEFVVELLSDNSELISAHFGFGA